MVEISVLFNQLFQLFLIMCVGYFVFKVKIFNEEVNKHLNSFVINITLPCLTISSVLTIDQKPENSVLITLFVSSIIFFIIMPAASFIIVKIMLKTMNIATSRQGIYMFMMIFSNVAFMGMPILSNVCGAQGATAVFYAAILNIIFNIAAFTYGIIIIGYGDTMKATFQLKNILTPGIICSILALFIYALNFHFGQTITSVLTTVGNLTSPLAMLLVGSTLATVELKQVFNEWRIYVFTIIKQILLPFIAYPIYRLFIRDDLLFTVMFIEFLMPVANIALIFSTQYHLDNKFVSKAIFISTLTSIVTIPLMMYICPHVYRF